jgi:uncharacterized damage-inducible protein DinB
MTNIAAAAVEKTSIVAPVSAEFREEAKTTRRVLERLPADKLNWRPHPKSLSLGQLALHIAIVPGRLVPMLQKTEHEVTPTSFKFEEAKNIEEILGVLNQSVRDAGGYLDGLTEEQARAGWTLKANGKTLFTKTRLEVVRMIMLSHVYHHRGQLSVYLRLLDVPVPSIYGPSADENPFM